MFGVLRTVETTKYKAMSTQNTLRQLFTAAVAQELRTSRTCYIT